MAAEEWREVPDCPGFFVSDIGRLRHHDRVLRLTPRIGHPSVYPQARLVRADGTPWLPSLHSVMLRAFVGPRPSAGHVGAHLDGNPLNDTIGNLAWVTYQENAEHRRRHGTAGRTLTLDDAREIRRLRAAGALVADLACRFKIDRTLVSHIVAGRVWREAA